MCTSKVVDCKIDEFFLINLTILSSELRVVKLKIQSLIVKQRKKKKSNCKVAKVARIWREVHIQRWLVQNPKPWHLRFQFISPRTDSKDASLLPPPPSHRAFANAPKVLCKTFSCIFTQARQNCIQNALSRSLFSESALLDVPTTEQSLL